ncbi:hypothetical protein Pmani_003403 [Petrolisthes manimaculis]|uniref:RING-type domain-containing protein n=1 Tax=Petrolisthes manimaculis TaxID=1843537 RepID=A0AAE1QGB8_9EUCA|nr:hypothetical protein Pmani_003403 [Petrolisthes manimaculis]
MDTKDTDIKQEPTAPGAEGNDGGFPQNNPAECGICFTLFDDIERRPRTLPCGHTCTSCLIVLLEEKELTCPSCRVKHRTTTINKIPINYNLEEMLRQQKEMQRHNKALASLIPSKNANTTEGLLPSNEDTISNMDTKDTDIKQEPTAPGAEGNDGGFPQNNPAECGICFTLFDDIERRPRTLPCGHTCTSCLIVLLEEKELTCPSCRVKHRTTTINKIPINYNLEEMLRQQKEMQRHNKALASLIPSKNANTTEGLLPSNEDTISIDI